VYHRFSLSATANRVKVRYRQRALWLPLILFAAVCSAQKGWYPHEGGLLKYRGKRGTGQGEFNTPHSVRVDSHQRVYVSDRENNRIQIFDSNGRFLRQWTHLGATQGMDVSPQDELWIVTHRNNRENLSYDTLAGRIMRVDIATGRILGSMESPGHWLSLGLNGDIFIGSLTGNIFRWYPGWVEGMSETAPGVVK
jgi:DNA-binding beta-propeller fold protein YncE